jgi:DNA invertase Pin-like site-specific DNA recombinase
LSDETSLGGRTFVLTTTGREDAQRSTSCDLSSNGLASREAAFGAAGRPYVAYYRVSTKQQGQSGLGLEGQQADVLRYLRESPGRLIAEVTEIESGKNDDRPKLREAMRLCRVYEATLVVARLDRLSRSLALISSIMESGLEFVVADFPLANRFTLHILAAVAEYEVWLIAERTRVALAAAKARGVKLGRPTRADWRAHFKQGNAASTAARLKRARARALDLAPMVCDLRDRGKSIGAIAVELTRMEIETLSGGSKWYPAAVRRVFFLSGEEEKLVGIANSTATAQIT